MDHSSAPSPNWPGWLQANASRYLLFARSQTRGEADAHDLLQEALVEVWQRDPHRPPDESHVFKTIRSRAIDLARRTDRRERREQAAPDWWQMPDDPPDGDDAEIEHAVKALPAEFREVLVLKIWSQLTFRQIADTLGIPPGTAASRYRYALEHLRHTLKEVRP